MSIENHLTPLESHVGEEAEQLHIYELELDGKVLYVQLTIAGLIPHVPVLELLGESSKAPVSAADDPMGIDRKVSVKITELAALLALRLELKRLLEDYPTSQTISINNLLDQTDHIGKAN